MSRRHREIHADTGLSAMPVSLLDTPLDFIAQDHLRIRAICAEMDRAADLPEMDEDWRARILSFLIRDLPTLLGDEDDVLFPLVLKRAEPEDELPRLQERLMHEHAQAMALLPALIALFSDGAPTAPLTDAGRDTITKFTSQLRRHLILENAVLMPLARLRLTPDDLAELAAAMKRARDPKEEADT